MEMHENYRSAPIAMERPSALDPTAEVLNDASMTNAEKRETLASWASDARALNDLPALRRLDNGAVIRLEDILKALRKLDDDDDDPPPSPSSICIPADHLLPVGQAA